MAEPKTKRTTQDPADFIAAVEGEKRRADCEAIAAMLKKATKEKAWMYGTSIVGFGSYSYVSGGKKLEAPRAAFSPRKAEFVIYMRPGFDEEKALLARLGKHKTAKVCLYFKTLDDLDRKVLQQLIDKSVAWTRENLPD